MSGFAAIFNTSNEPVDPAVLGAMRSELARRGPDAQSVWSQGPVGLVHSLLATTDEDAFDRQPLTLDQKVWIVADARVDARADTIHALRQAGDAIPDSSSVPDAEIILRAYVRWGEACLERLIGDFAFTIWDSQTQTVFAAHDQFGVVPLFYAETADCLILSNTLDAIRLDPAVSDELNHQAIGDFLSLGTSYDCQRTCFEGIQRLAAAECLVARDGRLRTRRYWDCKEADYVEPGEPEEAYVECFRTVFDQAVSDRLRGKSFITHLSGGMDSTSVAATAQRLLRDRGGRTELRAYTTAASRFVEDADRPFCDLVAEDSGIPLTRLNIEDYLWRPPAAAGAEPYNYFGNPDDVVPEIFEGSRVLLTGYGSDPAFSRPRLGTSKLLLKGRPDRFLRQVIHYKRVSGRWPGLGIRSAWRIPKARGTVANNARKFLNPEFLNEYGVEARINSLMRAEEHSDSREWMSRWPPWMHLFQGYDPGQSRRLLKVRHPFFDVRVIECIGRAPLAYGTNKRLLRRAMAGRLPSDVLRRAKVPFGGSWTVKLCRELSEQGLPEYIRSAAADPRVLSYVHLPLTPDRIPIKDTDVPSWFRMLHRTLALAFWLRMAVDRPGPIRSSLE